MGLFSISPQTSGSLTQDGAEPEPTTPAPLHALGPGQVAVQPGQPQRLLPQASARLRPAGTLRRPTPGHAGQSAERGISGYKGQTEHRQRAGSPKSRDNGGRIIF